MCLNGISFNLLPFVNSSLFVEYGHRKYWEWEDQVSDLVTGFKYVYPALRYDNMASSRTD